MACNKVTFEPSEDPDQPGYPSSLNRVFAVHLKIDLVFR